MKTYIICLLISIATLTGNAQIGYQVSLLDPETGAPRANQSVTVTIDITDSEGANIISDTQNATTNEFGILSLKVGVADSFANMDWNRLPMWISATVGGVVIGKSQILNVPVAEYAKTTGTLTPEILSSKTWRRYSSAIIFTQNGRGYFEGQDGDENEYFSYEIHGNVILIEIDDSSSGGALQYSSKSNKLFGTVYGYDGTWQ